MLTSMPSQTIITNQAAANFLLNSNYSHYLHPFIEQEKSLSEAAKTLNVKLSSFYHHAKKMLELKLIKVTGETIRNKHRIKLYNAIDEVLIVPISATSSIDLTSHLQELGIRNASYMGEIQAEAMLRQTKDWAFRIAKYGTGVGQVFAGKDGQGKYQSAFSFPESYPTYWNELSLNLELDAAKAIQADLIKLFEKYQDLASDKGKSYRLSLAFALDQEDED